MPFTWLNLNPALVKAIQELGFVRPTSIQAERFHPLSREGTDRSAETGSGRPRRSCPDHHRLTDWPRRTTRRSSWRRRASWPRRSSRFHTLSVHTPVTGAAVYGGVGMGRRSKRSGADATSLSPAPGRLIDHMRSAYARLIRSSTWSWTSGSYLDMGFLPEVRRIIATLPTRRQRSS